MIDITSGTENGLGVYDTNNFRAKNLLNVQLGSLEYAPQLGIDLNYFLSEEFEFQNESFRSYLVQVLATNGINVTSVNSEIANLVNNLTFNLEPTEQSGGLIAR